MKQITMKKESLIDYSFSINKKIVAWASREKLSSGYIYCLSLNEFENKEYCRNLTECKSKMTEYDKLGLFD